MTTWERVSPWLAIFAATLLAYSPALTGGLVLHDAEHITRPELRSLLGLQRIWFEPGATPHYSPLLHTVFWLEYRIWGDALLGYHLANVLQHALAACLVMFIVRRLELPGGFLAALLFALHPAAVESVAWISQQKNTLAAVFFLGAALVYVGYDRERIMWQYDVALALFVLALLTHPLAAALPAVLLVVFWWERGTLNWRRDIVPLLPWLTLAIGAGVLALWFGRHFGDPSAAASEPSLMQKWLIAGRAFWFYFATTLWPADLHLIHSRWSADSAIAWPHIYPLGALAIFIAAAWLARRNRGPLAAGLIFAGSLLPVLGFVRLGWFAHAYVAERFSYFAILGLLVPAAIALTRLGYRMNLRARTRTAAAGAIAAVLAIVTWHHSRAFRNAEALYRDSLASNPRAWLAHTKLGEVLETKPGALDEAIDHYRRALALNPDHPRSHSNLGRALARIPEGLPQAVAAFETSLRLQSDAPEVRVDYANALAQIPGRLPDALAEYENALHLAPDSAPAHFHFGRALEQAGRTREAAAAFETAVRLRPDYLEAYRQLGDALAADPGRIRDAIAAYEGALHLAPADAETHTKLAALLANLPERRGEARAHLEAASALQPGPGAGERVP